MVLNVGQWRETREKFIVLEMIMSDEMDNGQTKRDRGIPKFFCRNHLDVALDICILFIKIVFISKRIQKFREQYKYYLHCFSPKHKLTCSCVETLQDFYHTENNFWR